MKDPLATLKGARALVIYRFPFGAVTVFTWLGLLANLVLAAAPATVIPPLLRILKSPLYTASITVGILAAGLLLHVLSLIRRRRAAAEALEFLEKQRGWNLTVQTGNEINRVTLSRELDDAKVSLELWHLFPNQRNDSVHFSWLKVTPTRKFSDSLTVIPLLRISRLKKLWSGLNQYDDDRRLNYVVLVEHGILDVREESDMRERESLFLNALERAQAWEKAPGTSGSFFFDGESDEVARLASSGAESIFSGLERRDAMLIGGSLHSLQRGLWMDADGLERELDELGSIAAAMPRLSGSPDPIPEGKTAGLEREKPGDWRRRVTEQNSPWDYFVDLIICGEDPAQIGEITQELVRLKRMKRDEKPIPTLLRLTDRIDSLPQGDPLRLALESARNQLEPPVTAWRLAVAGLLPSWQRRATLFVLLCLVVTLGLMELFHSPLNLENPRELTRADWVFGLFSYGYLVVVLCFRILLPATTHQRSSVVRRRPVLLLPIASWSEWAFTGWNVTWMLLLFVVPAVHFGVRGSAMGVVGLVFPMVLYWIVTPAIVPTVILVSRWRLTRKGLVPVCKGASRIPRQELNPLNLEMLESRSSFRGGRHAGPGRNTYELRLILNDGQFVTLAEFDAFEPDAAQNLLLGLKQWFSMYGQIQ